MFPPDLDIHIIIDNYETHKTEAMRNWFAKRPRRHVHYTPVKCRSATSWSRLSAAALAKAIGVTPANEIVRGRRGVAAETALRLARYFNADARRAFRTATSSRRGTRPPAARYAHLARASIRNAAARIAESTGVNLVGIDEASASRNEG